MWVYPKDKLNLNWKLTDLYEQVAAAEQLGFDIVLIATNGGLEVWYEEKRPQRPYFLS